MNLQSACEILKIEYDPQARYSTIHKEIVLDDAKQSFRQLMMELHPDKGGDHNEALKVIEAHKFIKNYLSEKKQVTISEWMHQSSLRQKERRKEKRKEEREKSPRPKIIGPVKRKGRTIIQYSLSGEKIKEWASATDAAEFLKTDVSAINKCARGVKYYQTAANFIWKYPDEKIIQYSLNGQLIKEWDNSKEAAKSLNKHFSPIRKCARGIQDSAYGFVWKYKKDTEES
jgi:hypothetical protein